MATQLVWTLTGQQGNPPNIQNPPVIQAVQLEINGKPWTPSGRRLPGHRRAEPEPGAEAGHVRVQEPVPGRHVPGVLLRANGQAWSRCASQSQVTAGAWAWSCPVFGKTGAASLNPSCRVVGAGQFARPCRRPSRTACRP